MLGVHVLLGNEFFYIVNRYRIVNIAACAGVLAEFWAHSTAYGREGVLLFYKLKRFLISALGGKLYVSLNGDVSRAVCLARRRACFNDVFTIFAPVLVPVLLCPDLIVRSFGFSDIKRLRRTKFLT